MRNSWTNCPADREERGYSQIGGETRERSDAGSRCATSPAAKDEKRIWQSDSISSFFFSPSLAALRALKMCLEREFSKQGCHSERRLCATLTDLYGSSLRSLMCRGVVRVEKVSPLPRRDIASYQLCSR